MARAQKSGAVPRKTGSSRRDPRDRLLAIACDLFAQRGYDAVSTGDIAKAAGLTQSMVHYYFGSKENIWEAAIENLMRDFGRRFPLDVKELQDLDPLSRLKVLTRRFIRMSAGDPNFSRIIIHENLSHSERLAWLVDRFVAGAFAEFDQLIGEGIEAGQIKDLPLFAASNTIISASAFTFCLGPMLQQVHGVDLQKPEVFEALADSIIEIVFSGIAR